MCPHISAYWDELLCFRCKSPAYQMNRVAVCLRCSESWLRTACISALPSRSVSVDESRPEFICRLAVGIFSVSVLHIDPLSPAETSPNVNPLTPMAVAFFSRIEKMDPTRLSAEDFKSFRAVFAEACSHDHLRWTLWLLQKDPNAHFVICLLPVLVFSG